MQTIKLKISGMHCPSCGMNVDGELEDLTGVSEAQTSYAKAETVVKYDPAQVTPEQIKKVVSKLGYGVE